MTSYAIDFNKDEVKVTTTGYRANGQTVRPISSASMNCFVNKSFIEEQKGKEARGFTADGKSEIVITYRDKFTILDENVDLKFYLDNQEIDETIAGKVKEIQYLRDSISIILTAPEDFLVSKGSEYKVRMEVTPYRGGKPLSKIGYKYRVLRPGVVFIHGLGDNNTLFYDMIRHLISKEMYVNSQLFSVDYHESNTSSFMTNTTTNEVVKNGCEIICKKLFESDSIVSTKYDMVGHSMGGILARLYVQETSNGKESTNSIITLNTPHYGSQLGNIYGWAKKWERDIDSYIMSKSDKRFLYIDALLCGNFFKNDNNFQAINDLAMGSKAILALNGENRNKLIGIPVHSICTIVPEKYVKSFLRQQVKTKMEDKGIFGIRSWLLERLFANSINGVINGIYSGPSDLVVPLSSQQGGLSGFYTSEHEGTFENAMHIYAPHWLEVMDEVSILLQTHKDDNFFSMSGFPSNTEGARLLHSPSNEAQYIDHFEESKEESFISAVISPVSASDYTHICHVAHSEDMLTYEVFAMPTEESIIFGIDEKEMKFNLSDVECDELKFYIVGRTNYDALLLDSVVVNLKSGQTDILTETISKEKIHLSYGTEITTIHIPSSLRDAVWQLYSQDGILMDNGVATTTQICINNRKRGVYILELIKDNNIFTYKMLFEY